MISISATSEITVGEDVIQHEFHQFVDDMKSNHVIRRYRGTQKIRLLLNRDQNSVGFDTIVRLGVISCCVKFLKLKNNASLIFEACHILSSLLHHGTSEERGIIVKAGVVPPMLKLLNSEFPDIVGQCLSALGHIAGDCPQFRDLVVNKGIVPPLITLLDKNDQSLVKPVVWVVVCLSKFKSPTTPWKEMSFLLPSVAQLLNHQDGDIVLEACIILSHLSEGPNEMILEGILEADGASIVPSLVDLLKSRQNVVEGTSLKVVVPILKIIGNIAAGSDEQTEVLLKEDILPVLSQYLSHPKPSIVRKTVWVLSNICAGSLHQVSQVIKAGLIPQLISILGTPDFDMRKEAAWALSDIAQQGSTRHLVYLRKLGLTKALLEVISNKEAPTDWRLLFKILSGLESILKDAQAIGDIELESHLIRERGGFDKINALQSHEHSLVKNKAQEIIEQFFYDPTA